MAFRAYSLFTEMFIRFSTNDSNLYADLNY